jgi:ubiquinone/menaquinone biosynthesis C-methylase UbiE
MLNYTEKNSKAIDIWVEEGWEWGVPISHELFIKARDGAWDVLLSPCKAMPHEWLLPYYQDNKLTGVKLLGLASGGGQQMPVFAALGADCTVLDYSDRQLASEKLVAERESYNINIVKADMTNPLPFLDNSFDIIFHPVSNCYVEDVYHVWNECYRILKPGGLLIAGMDNGASYLFNYDYGGDNIPVLTKMYKMPFNPLKNPELYEEFSSPGDAFEFSHTIEEQIGGQLKAGFILTDLYEDIDTHTLLSHYNFPEYIATRAVKPSK